jgi:NAD(P)-dependent dehydrogenase (short-subunit alcohol dehydrogenase family)
MTALHGKTALVTGGSSGVGFAIAELLAERGARVMITGRDEDALESVLGRLGADAMAVRADSASLSDIDGLADRVRDDLGHLDALFVNAGVNGFALFEETTEQLYDHLQQINAKGPYFTVQKLSPLLVEGSGVVLTTSVANVHGFPTLSAYAASKGALRSMARTLARELLPRKIRVNAVSPGPIDTGVLLKSMSAEDAEGAAAQMAETNPMLRMGDPREVAVAAVFLAFDATFTTGAELPVDGGVSQL